MTRLMLLLFAVASMILVSRGGNFQKDSLPKNYKVKISKNGNDYDEQVSVNVQKGTETFHLQDASSGKRAGDIIHDFKRNLTMMRVPEVNSCFLSKLSSNIRGPSDLLHVLKRISGNKEVKITPRSEEKLKVVGILQNRSDLSKEMLELCEKLPIYRVTKGEVAKQLDQTNDAVQQDSDLLAQLPAKRTKRDCKAVYDSNCYEKCGFWSCRTICSPKCTLKCK